MNKSLVGNIFPLGIRWRGYAGYVAAETQHPGS